MTIIVRPATAKDVGFIMRANMIIDEKSEYKPPTYLTPERIRKDVLSENPLAYVDIAEFEDMAVGLIFYSFCYYASEGQGIWVTNIYSDATCRHQGIARILLQHIKDKHPDVCGIYGAISKYNTTARYFATHVGAINYDEYNIYCAPNTWSIKKND